MKTFTENAKRFFAAFLGCAFLFYFSFMHLSCGALHKKFSGGSLTLLLADSPENTVLQESALPAFKKKTGISVQIRKVSRNAIRSERDTALSGGKNDYDVVAMDADSVSEFAKAKQVEPLEGILSEDERGDILPSALSLFTVDGKLYAAPWGGRVLALIYNEELFAKSGVTRAPQTWDEFVAVNLAIKRKGISSFPTIWAWNEPSDMVDSYAAVAFSFGGKIFDEKGNPLFNQKEGILALMFMKEGLLRISDTMSLTADSAVAANAYMLGLNAMMVNWHTWNAVANATQKSKARGHSRIAPLPGMMGNMQTGLFDAAGFAIPSSSKHKEEAAAFIKFMMGADAQREIAMRAGTLPTVKSVYGDAELNETLPTLPQYESLVRNAKSFAKPLWYGKFLPVMRGELQQALSGKKSPVQALDDAAKEAKKLAAQ